MPASRQLRTLPQVLTERPWLSERRLRRLVAERRIPYHKDGPGPKARLLFDLGDIDAYAERGRIEPPTPDGLPGRARQRPDRGQGAA